MKVSKQGIEIIKKHESCKLKAYLCPVGKLTIGYGHTRGVTPDMVITPIHAQLFLEEDLLSVENFIRKHIKVSLSQNQIDAISSLVFNVKTSSLIGSNLLLNINAGNIEGIKKYWLMWNKGRVNGELVVLPGLVKRRKEELDLYLS